jgi:uncharacterized protein (DUF433 family)
VNDKKDGVQDKERVCEALGELPPEEAMDNMTASQIQDLLVDTAEMPVPESVMDRMLIVLEERAQAAGYDNLDAYMEAHPEGMTLLSDPITIQLDDKEQDEMRANNALRQHDPIDDEDQDLLMEFYRAAVTLFMSLNKRHDDLVVTHPALMAGKPCVRDSRIPVDMILALLAEEQDDGSYLTIRDITEHHYNSLTVEEVGDAVAFAGLCVRPRLLAEAMLFAEDEDEDGESDA